MRVLSNDASTALPALDQVRAKLCRRSLADMVRKGWHVLEPTTPLTWNWHLDAMCAHVQALYEGRIPKNNLLITVPPGSMKSLIVSVFAPAWRWIEHPEFRSIFASANPRVTVRDSLRCRDLILSDWYQQLFRPKWRLVDDQNTKTLFRNTARGWRMAVSANSKVTGDRGDGVFWDDLLDAADTNSQTERESVIYWLDHAFSNRIANPQKGIRCGVMQRLHEVDPGGHVIESGEYEVLSIPQELPEFTEKKPRVTTSIGWTDPRTQTGELMFPTFFDEKFLAKERRRLGPSTGYAAQHLQDPAPVGGIIFKREWWKVMKMPAGWKEMPIAQLRNAMGITRIASGWDTALGEKQSNDFTSNHVIAELENKYLVLHWNQDKMTAPTTKTSVVANHARWQPEAVPIEGEGSASGKAIVQMLKGDTRVPAIEVPNIAKEIRWQKVSPTCEAGLVYLPEGEEWVEEFITYMAKVPRGAHDDAADSFAVALEWLLFGESTTGMIAWMKAEAQEAEEKRRALASGSAA